MISAVFFDGESARRHRVNVWLTGTDIRVEGEGFEHTEPFHSRMLSQKLGNAPRQLHLSNGGYALIQDHASLEAMLRQSGIDSVSAVSRLESRWGYAFASLVATALFCVAFYIWGLPVMATAIAQRVPAHVAAQMDMQTLKLLDNSVLAPSELSAREQQAIVDDLHRLALGKEVAKPEYKLIFRSSPAIGPNAFAMPGGTILVTDQLVKLAEQPPADSKQVLGVLAHELGHVHHNHAMRQLIQGSVVALVMTWFLGDISTVVATVPTLLLQTRYTRIFETQADEYAIHILKRNGMSPGLLADLLKKLEASNRLEQDTKKGQNTLEGYFSTHPMTEDRINRMRIADDEN